MDIITPQNNSLTNYEQILKFLERHKNAKLFLVIFYKSIKTHRLRTFVLCNINRIKLHKNQDVVCLEMHKKVKFFYGKFYPLYHGGLLTYEYLSVPCFHQCLFNIYSKADDLNNITSNMTICPKEKVTSLLHSSVIWEKNTARKKAFKEEVFKEFNKFRYFPPKLEIRE